MQCNVTSFQITLEVLWLTNALQLLHTCLQTLKWKRRTCFYKNHFNSTNPITLLYYPSFCGFFKNCHRYHFIKSPNFTGYWDHTSPFCLLDPLLQLGTARYSSTLIFVIFLLLFLRLGSKFAKLISKKLFIKFCFSKSTLFFVYKHIYPEIH